MILEPEDHSRDAAFCRALHKDTATGKSGLFAILNKDNDAQKIAVDQYFKHWDQKPATDETSSDREVCLYV